ncbi:hypothetical protein L484_014321 [Morus notabilis]|uniref:Thioredoxin-like fold domain-containing protein n=1 Tax=Morus notabilis TaxID=981085 RepID=W9RK40_9ROSA|nr:hypothetical protein L484_014321 [Morus notabilis]
MRAFGQQIPPMRIRGFSYQNRRYVHLDSIMIGAFLDQICPYSKASWPSLKQAADFYPSHLSLVVHLFPLPYHDNAFAVSRALHTVNMMTASATFPMLEEFFKHQERFNHNETRHLSRTSIVNEIVKFTTGVLGDSYEIMKKQDCPLR